VDETQPLWSLGRLRQDADRQAGAELGYYLSREGRRRCHREETTFSANLSLSGVWRSSVNRLSCRGGWGAAQAQRGSAGGAAGGASRQGCRACQLPRHQQVHGVQGATFAVCESSSDGARGLLWAAGRRVCEAQRHVVPAAAACRQAAVRLAVAVPLPRPVCGRWASKVCARVGIEGGASKVLVCS